MIVVVEVTQTDTGAIIKISEGMIIESGVPAVYEFDMGLLTVEHYE
jgi:hypothetical protein